MQLSSLSRSVSGLAFLALPAAAQIANPADTHKQPQSGQMPEETFVTSRSVSDLREEDRIGPYGQPEWTAHRRFPFTRTYVRPPGTFSFEYWVRPTIPRKKGQTSTITQYEFEMGLPGRWQIDLYLNENKEGKDGGMASENAFEVRYALADWGKLWGNPTLYAEYVSRDTQVDKAEWKLLLGDELAPSWHWGTNLYLERELGGGGENDYGLTAGLSKTLDDQRFSLGAELKTEFIDTSATRGTYDHVLLVGPSLQYRPTTHLHLDFAPLIGIGPDSPAMQALFVLGYEF
ncbi:MAG: hypothetical protein IPJ19_08240 [Planctomycetes bacterium]|nr:hypothetical protein [Planctomycetota bacterium]